MEEIHGKTNQGKGEKTMSDTVYMSKEKTFIRDSRGIPMEVPRDTPNGYHYKMGVVESRESQEHADESLLDYVTHSMYVEDIIVGERREHEIYL